MPALPLRHRTNNGPDSKRHGANMGPIWGRQDPGGPDVGHTNLAISGTCYYRGSVSQHDIWLKHVVYSGKPVTTMWFTPYTWVVVNQYLWYCNWGCHKSLVKCFYSINLCRHLVLNNPRGNDGHLKSYYSKTHFACLRVPASTFQSRLMGYMWPCNC